jgi:hypothetical protein
MKLTVIANYGSDVNEISSSVTVEKIEQTMNSINWNNFHQVVLSLNDHSWIEVGGNLTDDGLSVTYEENGRQYIIDQPPSSVDGMIKILLSYYAGDGRFKSENVFV